MQLVRQLTLKTVLACAAVAALASGCAQDRPILDRVQPNVTKKTDLLGREWYMRSTVVETNFAVASSFPGAMSKLTRGVFDIQQNALYFYRTYEFMEGSEAYAQKSDYDVPLRDKDGKIVEHAVPQDYQQVRCEADGDCLAGARCADRWRKDAWPEEGDWHGYCVRKAKKFIYKGAPVLAYPIASHFDIVQDYSPATGEKTNVRVENTTDRKWFDREYMRVQWGAQQVLSFDHDVMAGSAWTADPTIYAGDAAPEGEGFEQGETKLTDSVPQKWFNYAVRVIASPPTTMLQGFGEIPVCFFYPWYSGGVYDCSSEEMMMRYSFLEVPQYKAEPSRAYVAREGSDVEMEKFGFFRTERPTYDIQFGNTFGGAVRRDQRHRIWDKYVKCYTDAAAKPAPGEKPVCKAESKDTVWRGELDYSKMTPTPIIYYLNADHPRELVNASKEIVKRWSVPFEDVVAFHKGQKPAHPMYILCENSDAAAKAAVAAGQPVAEWSGTALGKQFCKEMDKEHRFGDVRWSVMHAVPQPIQAGLYGYGPSAADPLTGEVISASAHAYAGVMKQGAETALQNLELLAGVKDFNDIKRADEKKFKGAQMVSKTLDLRSPKLDNPQSLAEVQAAVGGMMDPDVRDRLQSQGLPLQDNGGSYAQMRLALVKQAPELNALLSGDDDGHTIASMFKDPRVMSVKGPSSYTADQLQAYSLANWNHTAARMARDKVYNELAAKTIHFQEFADNAILGLADEYGRQYDKAVCEMYRKETGTLYDSLWTSADNAKLNSSGTDYVTCATPSDTYQSFGAGNGGWCQKMTVKDLASKDPNAKKEMNVIVSCSTKELMQRLRVALNAANGGSPLAESLKLLPGPLYTDNSDPVIRRTQDLGRALTEQLRSKYKFELWERIYMGTQEHEVGHTLGLRHNFEASTDTLNFDKSYWTLKLKPGSQDEVLNPLQDDTLEQALGRIREKQLASVMDYTSKFNGRYAGVGRYDRAAIKFGYGDIVEAFNKVTPADLDKDPDGAGGPLAAANKYLETPEAGSPATKMLQFQGNTPVNVLTRRLHYSTLPKYLGGVDSMYDRKDISWRDLKGDRCQTDADCGSGMACSAFGEDKYCKAAAVVEVPYRFCSDEYNGQTPNCATWDEGVDAYEIARNALDDYENYWWFYGYARDSEMFYPIYTYTARVERALAMAVRQFQYWAVDFATYQKDGWWQKRYGVPYDQDPNGGLSGGLATLNTFNKMAQVLARPSCGYYGYNPNKEKFEPYTDVDNAQFSDLRRVDETMGCRPLYPGYDYSGYMYRPESGGQMIDRLAALSMLTDPTLPRFIAFNENEDTRRFLVSFYNVFPRQLTNLLAAMSVEDAKYYGWRVVQGKDENSDELVPREWVGPKAKDEPKSCAEFPADATAQQKQGCLKYNVFPDARPVFPSSRFRMPLQAAYYGMAVLTQGFNRTYMDVSRIFLAGHHAKVDLPPSLAPEDVATFTDPLSGKTYVAPKVANDTLNPGYLAVKLAEAELAKWKSLGALQDNYLFSEYQFRVSLLDIVRSLHEVYDR